MGLDLVLFLYELKQQMLWDIICDWMFIIKNTTTWVLALVLE
jgi:hypothetical protein